MTEPVHHLAAGGTLDEISYTACGLYYDAGKADPDWGKVTCVDCLRSGPRSDRREPLPRSGMSDPQGIRENRAAPGQERAPWQS